MKNPFIQALSKKKHLKIYLYGDSGVGKTYFSLTFPKVAIIDLEGGTDFFSARFPFHVLDTKSFTEVLDAVNFLERGGHDFKTLVIDPVTLIWSALQEGRLEFKTRNPDKAVSGEEKTFFTYQDWGQLKRFYSLLMTKLINLPLHIVLTSRLKDEYEINGGEMTKIGVKPEAEKSTAYIADIRFRLEVDRNGRRVAIFEKDRTGHFDRGTRVENPSYETFRPLVEEVEENALYEHDYVPQAIHPDDNEAAEKDAEFFKRRSHTASTASSSGNGGGGRGRNGNGYKNTGNGNGKGGNNGQKSIPVGLLFTTFTSLGLKGLLPRYKAYCCRKYKTGSIHELTEKQRVEQKAILESCRNNQGRRAEFESLLRDIQVKEEEGEAIKAHEVANGMAKKEMAHKGEESSENNSKHSSQPDVVSSPVMSEAGFDLF